MPPVHDQAEPAGPESGASRRDVAVGEHRILMPVMGTDVRRAGAPDSDGTPASEGMLTDGLDSRNAMPITAASSIACVGLTSWRRIRWSITRALQ